MGKLAKYLRFMGYDTLYFPHIEDDELVDLARREVRTILTRDRELSWRKNTPVFYLEPVDLDKQLRTRNEITFTQKLLRKYRIIPLTVK